MSSSQPALPPTSNSLFLPSPPHETPMSECSLCYRSPPGSNPQEPICDDMIDETLQFLRAIPSDKAPERPSKRRKVEATCHLLELHREQLIITKRLPEALKVQDCFSWQNIDAYIDIHNGAVHIHPGNGASETYLSISLGGDEVPESVYTLIAGTRKHSRSRRFGSNRFNLGLDLNLDLQGQEVVFTLVLKLLWMEGPSFSSESQELHEERGRRLLLKSFFPNVPLPVPSASRSPQLFYKAAHVTKAEAETPSSLVVPGLAATLYPFQRRAVRWMMKREGVKWQSAAEGADDTTGGDETDGADGTTVNLAQPPRRVPFSFAVTHAHEGQPVYMSDLFGFAARDPSSFLDIEDSIKGGILAEEMGLGKTLEIIGLMLLHRRSAEHHSGGRLSDGLMPTPATLIITPPTLRDQWVSELSRHAPKLSVMAYKGIKNSSARDEKSEAALVEELSQHDVVIMTYNELRSEIHFAKDPPGRSRRQERKYYRPKSPLMQLSWWRVCLDEAQEVDSGVSNAALLARMIPRVNAWAVTGTPIKDNLDDLRGLLLFLRHENFAQQRIWQRLPAYESVFLDLFGAICLRHTKRLVRHELELPAQKRYVINIPFNAVEEQYYARLFGRLVEGCDLDAEGRPTVGEWRPDKYAARMRNCLDTLRKAALHPHVGGAGADRALGWRGANSQPMRTVSEVLEFMLQEAEGGIVNNQRALLGHRLTRGQLLEDGPRKREALAIWEAVLDEVSDVVQTARGEIEALKASNLVAEDDDGDDDDDDDDDDDAEADRVGGSTRIGEMQRRLRYALEIQHRAVFFIANAQFQIKNDEEMTELGSDEFKRLEKLEEEHYARAKTIRQEILQESHRKACRLMDRFGERAQRQGFTEIPEAACGIAAGIETGPVVDVLEELCAALNEQADQIDVWREKLIELLLKPLVDEDKDENEDGDEDEGVELTGDEYGDSTKVQEEIIVYVQVLRAALADRHAAISGQSVSKLVVDETRASLALAVEDEGPAPQKMIEVFAERERVAPNRKGLRSLRALMAQLRAISGGLASLGGGHAARAQLELEVVGRLQALATRQSGLQAKAQAALEREVDAFTSAMNARVEYYRQLQEISDSVAPYEGNKGLAEGGGGPWRAMEAILREERTLGERIEKGRAEWRYLLNLKEGSASDKDEIRTCPICQNDITNGVITLCGHQFDKDCLLPWLSRADTCPTCKRRVRPFQLHPFVLKPQTLRLVEGVSAGAGARGQGRGRNEEGSSSSAAAGADGRSHLSGDGSSPSSKKKKDVGIYTDFGEEKLAEIKAVDLDGPSFTTKVDAIVRHLLWLRGSDPGAKSIIFSQYTDFFGVLSDAFERYRIGFSSIGERGGIQRFTDDPSVECFLLHARAQSSGLNLVNASHVILCEPLLNTALELQAIARVDRIGQQQDTTVWLYIVEGTVEESIHRLSVRRRLEHMVGRKALEEVDVNVANSGRGVRVEGKGKGKGRDDRAGEGGGQGEGGEEEGRESDGELELEAANSMEMQSASLTKLMRKDKEGRTGGEEVPVDDLWNCIFGHVKGRAERGGVFEDEEDEDDGDDEERLRNDLVVRARMLADAAEGRIRAGMEDGENEAETGEDTEGNEDVDMSDE